MVAASNASVSSTQSGDGTHLASVLPGTDSLGSCEEESSCSTTPSDRVSLSDRTSTLSSSSEGPLKAGGCSTFGVPRFDRR